MRYRPLKFYLRLNGLLIDGRASSQLFEQRSVGASFRTVFPFLVFGKYVGGSSGLFLFGSDGVVLLRGESPRLFTFSPSLYWFYRFYLLVFVFTCRPFVNFCVFRVGLNLGFRVPRCWGNLPNCVVFANEYILLRLRNPIRQSEKLRRFDFWVGEIDRFWRQFPDLDIILVSIQLLWFAAERFRICRGFVIGWCAVVMIFSLERLGCDRLVALNFQFLVKRKISRSRSIVGGFVRHGKAARSRILVTDMWKTAKSMSLPVPTRVIRRVQPVISLRSRRKAGIVYRIPYLLDRFRRFSFALRWFRFSVRERSERTYKSRLVEEFMSLANRQGSTWQRRRSLYKTALLNRGFLRLLRHLF